VGPALIEPCDVVFRFVAGEGGEEGGGGDRYNVVTSAIKSNVTRLALRLASNVTTQV
jgi:hypothetical protein